MMAAVDDPGRPPRSLTIYFVDLTEAGPVEVAVTVERSGRTTTALSLRLEQGGRTVALALGTCGTWREGEPEWADGAPPSVPAPDECPPLDPYDRMPPFVDRLEVRFAAGGAPGSASEDGWNAAWLRTRPGRPLDHLTLAALSDGWLPAACSKLGRFAIVPTLDLTIHFRSPLPPPGAGGNRDGWVLAVFRSRFSAGGTWEEDGELWSEDGTLLGQSRQLAMLREPR
jgi:acyl-CoA thioesterase